MIHALLYRPETALPAWWLVLSFVLTVALLPVLGAVWQSPQRRRVLVLLAVAVIAGCGVASAAYGPWPDWCNPDWIPYMICWPW